ncbi:MAG: potassium transporter ATPase, partial [Frankiales bacterium]|nr:potassium transporter ATPase [Frankiales bacterium]
QASADRLLDLALRGGGPDNITMIVADVVDASESGDAVIVAGAAADAPQSAPNSDSAASRARVAEGRDVEPAPSRRASVPLEPAGAHRGRRRTALVVAGVVVVLLAAAGTGWAYVRSQYYVGVDAGQVAVYRGVSGTVAGLPLADVQHRTALSTERLSEIETEQLQEGIVAADADDAQRIVQRLEEAATPCPTALPTPTPVPRQSPLPKGSPVPTPSTVAPAVEVPAGCPALVQPPVLPTAPAPSVSVTTPTAPAAVPTS